MNSRDVISLGLGLEPPWEIKGQILDTEKVAHELRLTIKADRGARYPALFLGPCARVMISR